MELYSISKVIAVFQSVFGSFSSLFNLKKNSLFFFINLLPLLGFAQSLTINGLILSPKGIPLPGVILVIKNTSRATVSTFDGSFIFRNVNSADTFLITHEGYLPHEEPVDGREIINITLEKEISYSMPDTGTVLVGFGKSGIRNISAGVVSLQESVMNDYSAGSIEEFLIGRAPGLLVRKYDGQPGSGISVRIRGVSTLNNNEPMWIVDGVVLNAGLNLPGNTGGLNPLSSLHPADVESITVLKDASAAAIYGARGANGVILVTTRRGKESGLWATYSGNAGFETPVDKIETMTFPAYSALIDEIYANSGFQVGSRMNWNDYAAVDWHKQIYRTGKITDHNLSFYGGNERNKFYVSANFHYNQGVLNNSKHQVAGLRLNDDLRLFSWMNAGISMNISSKNGSAPNSGDFLSGSDPILSAFTFPPFEPSGSGIKYPQWVNRINPVTELNTINSGIKGKQFSGSAFLKIRPVRNLEFESRFSTDYLSMNNSMTKGPVLLTDYVTNNFEETGTLRSVNTDHTLNYTFKSSKSTFSMTAGLSTFSGSGNATQERELITVVPGTPGTQGTSTSVSTSSDGAIDYSSLGIFFTGNCVYRDRIDLGISLRQDRLNQIEASVVSLPYTSLATGYWLVKEGNNSGKRYLNGLKMKIGWGRAGSVNAPSYGYPVESRILNLPEEQNATYHGLSKAYPDPAFQPEYAEDWNLGIHSWMFRSKFGIDFEFFDRVRSNMAFYTPGILNEGNGSFWFNNGRLHQSGFELVLNCHEQINDLIFDFSFNLTRSKNQILNLNGLVNQIPLVSETLNGKYPVTVIQQGQPVGAFYGYLVEGIFSNQKEVDDANNLTPGNNTFYQDENTAPGDYKYMDLDWNGYIDENDQTVLGNPEPDFTYGLNFKLKYHQFEFLLTGEGSKGNEVFNLNNTSLLATGGYFNRSERMLNRWSFISASSTLPRVYFTDPNRNSRPNNLMVEDGSFFRLADLKLSITLKDDEEKDNFKISVGFLNLFSLSGYHGDIQSVGFGQGRNSAQGLDYGLYPRAMTGYFAVKYFF